jgi:arginyl-tRNA synthetase
MRPSRPLTSEVLAAALARAAVRSGLSDAPPAAEISVPHQAGHGDHSSNLALILARAAKKPPRAVAEALVAALELPPDLIEKTEIAGPGFINFTLSREALWHSVQAALTEGLAYGASGGGAAAPVQVEFVSANPTGPVNVVNARAAAVGDALARCLRARGHAVQTEFYVNDMGTQIDLLGRSLRARLEERLGAGPGTIPEGGYPGEYLADAARSFAEAEARSLLDGADDGRIARRAVEEMLGRQRRDLESYGVAFDEWFRQSALYPPGSQAVFEALETLRAAGFVAEREGAQWFLSTRFGDEEDRVLVRGNGEPTYFLADIAYHVNKRRRGFGRVIDIWGPDHHGHIPRMQAAVRALGHEEGWLEILIVQQVNLLREGTVVKMSKRAGEFVTLADLVEEVGVDAARFFFLMRRTDSHLDFDLSLAKMRTVANPVFYVQYGHARIASLVRHAGAAERGPGLLDGAEPGPMVSDAERILMKRIADFPEVVAGAADAREPHRLTGYLRELAADFHVFYERCRVVGEAPPLMRARLALAAAAGATLEAGLSLMGVSAPESM